MAIPSSVTVSMAALTTGVFSPMFRENRLLKSVSPGRISEYCGISRTSSKVKPNIGSTRPTPEPSPEPARPVVVVISASVLSRSIGPPADPRLEKPAPSPKQPGRPPTGVAGWLADILRIAATGRTIEPPGRVDELPPASGRASA